MGSSSGSWTTYFTPESGPVTLSSAGDQLKVTWVFTPTGVSTSNTSQGFPVAVVDSPSAARLTSDASPSSAAYTGYAVFMNMGQTLNHSHSFQLMVRNASGDLLSSAGLWTGVADGATKGNHGYDSGTQYTFVMTITRNATNGLDIVATMTGGTLNNSGVASASYTDGTPNGGSYSFDTFALRPNTVDKSASQFDTALFKVEYIPGATPPSITTDPQSQTVYVSQTATFNVLASGTLPLSYQWYYNTDTVLANATNATLTIPNAQTSDAGGYSAIVSNAYGSVTSAVAQLTVSIPSAPSIITQPQDQIDVIPGATATFSVVAGGSEPLSYQWYFNGSTPLAGANDSILSIPNVQVGNAGSYSVVVSNLAGTVTSSNAVLTVDTSPTPPVFTSQPASQVVPIGGIASFSAVAAGTAPISYQWKKAGVPIPGATSSTLTLTNVQTSDAGTYAVAASNSVGTATSSNAVLTVTTTVALPNSAFNLTGFAQGTTGGGMVLESNATAWRKVYNAVDLANVLNDKTGNVKVIEIMNDLDLGYNEIPAEAKATSEPFRQHTSPSLHPVLLVTGVSKIDIQDKRNLTIFSANGATIRHASLNVKRCANVLIRNLRFDELWEWDEATKGDYDSKDWDFITIGDSGTCSNVWVDHCTFTKSYDGGVDVKGGSHEITFSWNKFVGDDGATNLNSWVWQQINALESNISSYAMYKFLRTNGFSKADIVTISQGHEKTHLIGANTSSENANFRLTFHHCWFINTWDRLPRLRAGNVHNYNIFADDTGGLAARRLRDERKAAMSPSAQTTLEGTYNFKPFLNGSISTEGGAVLVEKSVYRDCLWPLRNNQTDPSDPFYTGKIQALDTIYQFDSTVVRGNSTDPNNPLGPFQAPVIAFSWNLPGGVLPYSYEMDDPSQVPSIVSQGAGAGVVNWAKTNWLMTAYPPSAPVIVAEPQSQTASPGDTVTFTVIASGSTPLRYQWYFNAITPVAGATNSALSLTNVQSSDAGAYSVIVSNSAGTATSTSATLSLGSETTPFEDWQTRYWGSPDNPDAVASADPDGDGMNNEAEFLAGTDPTNSASALRITSAVREGANVVISWLTGAGRTNVVQASAGEANGYSTNFYDVSDWIIIPGVDQDVATNYVDVGGATNTPARYYRVRLAP
jgi:pectate lyase